MPRLTYWLVAAALASSLLGFSSSQVPRSPDFIKIDSASQKYAPGILVVGFTGAARGASVAALQQALHAQQVASLPQIDVVVMQVASGQEQEAALLASKDPAVAFAEPDYAATADSASSPDVIPDDSLYNQQWALSKIGMPGAWGKTTGSPNILVAVVDTGVQLTHPDLQAKIWTNPGEIPANYIDDDGNGKIDDLHGWHFYHGGYGLMLEDANVVDDYGHGSHVSGIIAASANNHTGVAGISWGSRILPVKALDNNGNGYYTDIAAGIIYAADNGADIINLSAGGSAASTLLQEAVDYANAHGALVIAASGNNGGAVYYPAACNNVLAVAATDEIDQRPSFSNYGPQVDLAAPGLNIVSTWYMSNYLFKSGTSMSAPHVSGVAALLWSLDPSLSASEVANLLFYSAVDIGPSGKDIYYGWGRVSADRAVGLVVNPRIYLPIISKH
jgi:subtilisin family serine protease